MVVDQTGTPVSNATANQGSAQVSHLHLSHPVVWENICVLVVVCASEKHCLPPWEFP